MGKKRRSDLEVLVQFFTSAPLAEAGNALLVAKAIVAGRNPQAPVARGKRSKKPAGVEDETIANA